jgi:hypothetical protein
MIGTGKIAMATASGSTSPRACAIDPAYCVGW